MSKHAEYTPSLTISYEHSPIPENLMLQTPPGELLNLDVFPGTYFGKDTLPEFANDIMQDILDRPDIPHLVLAFGKPGSGKTSILHELLDQATRGQTNLRDFAKQQGKKFELIYLPWGDPFNLLPQEIKRDEGYSYHETDESRVAKLQEIALVEDILGEKFYDSTTSSVDPDTIRIVFSDMPLITGVVLDTPSEEATLGLPRGFNLLKKLLSNQHDASGNLKFTSHAIAVVAEPDIVEMAMKNRDMMLQLSSISEIKAVMEESGIIFTTDDDNSQLIAYKEEVAPRSEAELLDRDIADTLLGLFARKILKDKFTPTTYDELLSLGGEKRINEIIAQQLLPLLMSEVGFHENETIILHNASPLDTVHVPLDISTHRPLRDRHTYYNK
jgi:hypothetical protein